MMRKRIGRLRMQISLVDLKAQYGRIRHEVDAAVREVIENTAFVGGPGVQAFEKEFADYCLADHALGVSSGTSALHLALIGAGIGKGDVVVMPSHTFIATAEVVRRVGAQVRFVDIDPATFTIDPARLDDALDGITGAVIPVHLYGHPADMDPIMAKATSRGVAVIEDAAQSHGALYKGRRCGGLSAWAAFSFYPGKNLGAYGDAGMITSSDGEGIDRLRSLANHGRSGKHLHNEEGFNCRLDAIQAAVLRVKLRHLDQWNAERRRAAAWYTERLAGLADVSIPGTAPWAEHVFHLYVVRVPERDRLFERMQADGIGVGLHYPVPLHLQPAYAHLGHGRGDFPVTEEVCSEILSLPIYPEITEDQVDQVVESLRRSL